MKYKNPTCKKVRGSHMLLVSCGHCKTDIAKYQKQGRGNLLKMHIDRVIEGSIDFSNPPKALICPECNEQLGTKIQLKQRGTDVYRMRRSAFNTKELDY